MHRTRGLNVEPVPRRGRAKRRVRVRPPGAVLLDADPALDDVDDGPALRHPPAQGAVPRVEAEPRGGTPLRAVERAGAAPCDFVEVGLVGHAPDHLPSRSRRPTLRRPTRSPIAAGRRVLIQRNGNVAIDCTDELHPDVAFQVGLAVRAVDALMPAAGAGGLKMALPLQRQFRDIHAASAHIALTWDVHAAAYGQSALGLQPQGGLLL